MDSWQDIKTALRDGTVDQLTVHRIIKALSYADQCYHDPDDTDLASPFDDHEYDALKRYAQRVAPTDQYFIGIGSAVRGGKIKLPYKMGSLDQVNEGEYSAWVARHSIQNEFVVISDKLDGISALLVYKGNGDLQIAYSRGDGVEGADITRHVSKIHNVPTKIRSGVLHGKPLVLRAEIIMKPETFKKVQPIIMSRSGQPYKNPRNMVAGLMNASSHDMSVYEYIDLVTYEVLDSEQDKQEQLNLLAYAGFKTARYSVHTAGQLNDEMLTRLLNLNRATSEYEIDGLVIDVDDYDQRQRINPTRDTLNPAYAVKFKVADASNRAEPLVTGVTWAISKDGYFKPTIQIEPTELVGVTIRNCTGFNAKFIKENGIGPGARIVLVRSGDVIPFCQSVVSPSPSGPQMPEETNVIWTPTGVDLVLADANDNETVRFERLLDFISTIEIDHLGEGNLRPIFDAGFDLPEDVITLTQEDLSALVNSTSIGRKIFLSMRERLTNIPEYVLMGAHPAMGRGVGVRKMKKLWEAFHGDMSKCVNIDTIAAVEGFDQKTAIKITNGYSAYQAFRAKVEKVVTLTDWVAPLQGALTGKAFVFTGFRSKELEKAVEAAGGKMGSTVSSRTSYVVADDVNSTSGKAANARSLGVPVISVQQLKDLLNEST